MFYSFHFIDKDKVQRGKTTCLKSHSEQLAELGFKLSWSSSLQSLPAQPPHCFAFEGQGTKNSP